MTTRKLRCISFFLSVILSVCPVSETLIANADTSITSSSDTGASSGVTGYQTGYFKGLDENGYETGETYDFTYRIYREGGTGRRFAVITNVDIKNTEVNIRIPSEINGVPVTSVITFNDCYALKNVYIPTQVHIGGAFSGCYHLKSIIFECDNSEGYSIDHFSYNSHNIMINDSFDNCSAITELRIPKSVSLTVDTSFSNCRSLSKVTLWYDSRISVYDSFKNTSVKEVDYYGTEEQAEQAGLKKIFPYARINCLCRHTDGILWYPNGDGAAIAGFDKTEDGIYIVPDEINGKAVNEINTAAFPDAEAIYFSGTKEEWSEFEVSKDYADSSYIVKYGYKEDKQLGDYKAEICGNEAVLTGYTGKETDVVIPYEIDGIKVTSLKNTFADNKNIQSVEIPSTVTDIVGTNPFRGAESLRKITVANENASFTVVDGVLYSRDRSCLIACPPAKEGSSFVVPRTVSEIGSYAFADTSFDLVYFPASVETFGESPFTDSKTALYFEDERYTINDRCYKKSMYSPRFCCAEIKDDIIYTSEKEVKEGEEYTYNGETMVSDSHRYVRIDDHTAAAYAGNGGDVVIHSSLGGKPVTDIKEELLKDREDITSVKIEEGIGIIGDRAFYGCDEITSVEIPEGITSIGKEAFCGCSALSEVSLPSTLENIGDCVFDYCGSIKSVIIPESSNYFCVEGNAIYSKDKSELIRFFGETEQLTVIPETVKKLYPGALMGLGYFQDYSVYIPETVTDYQSDGWVHVYREEDGYKVSGDIIYSLNENGAVIEYIANLPDTYITPETIDGITVTAVGERAFAGNNSLNSITFSEGINEIYHELKFYTEYDDIDSWNSHYFYKLIMASDDAQSYEDYTETELMDADEAKAYIASHPELNVKRKQTYRYETPFEYKNLLNEISLPESFKELDTDLLRGLNLLKLTVNAKDMKITGDPLRCTIYGYIGSESENYALDNGLDFCPLDEIDTSPVKSGNFTYRSIGIGVEITKYTTSSSESEDVIIPAEIDGRKVISIGSNAFTECDNVRSVTISEGIRRIENGAFSKYYSTGGDNRSISEINIPASVKEISGSIDTPDLKVITVDEANDKYKAIDNVLYDAGLTRIITYPTGKTDKVYTMPDTLSGADNAIGNSYTEKLVLSPVFENIYMIRSLQSLREIEVQEGNKVLYSEDGVLYSRGSQLVFNGSYYAPVKDTVICLELYPAKKKDESFVVPENVSVISRSAFDNSSELKKLTLPSTVEMINSDFYKSSISEFDVAEENKALSANNGVLFSKDGTTLIKYPTGKKDESYTVPEKVKTIGQNAFGYAKVKNVILPEGLEIIGSQAFYFSELEDISIPSSVKEIGSLALESKYLWGKTGVVVNNGWLIKYTPDKAYHTIPLTDENGNYSYDDYGNHITDGKIYYSEEDPETGDFIEVEVGNIDFIVPEGVKRIASNVFTNTLENNVYLPSSLEYIGKEAFYYNERLTDIYYSGSKEDWEKIEKEPQSSYNDEPDPLALVVMHYGNKSPVQPVTTTTKTSATTANPLTTTKAIDTTAQTVTNSEITTIPKTYSSTEYVSTNMMTTTEKTSNATSVPTKTTSKPVITIETSTTKSTTTSTPSTTTTITIKTTTTTTKLTTTTAKSTTTSTPSTTMTTTVKTTTTTSKPTTTSIIITTISSTASTANVTIISTDKPTEPIQNEFMLGDVNNDGKIDANDATTVLVNYSLLSTGEPIQLTEEQQKAADVNEDGKIDASDATKILQYYSYLSTGGDLDFKEYMKQNG